MSGERSLDETSLFLDAICGEGSSSILEKLPEFNKRISLLCEEISQYKKEMESIEKFISSVDTGMKLIYLLKTY